MDGYTSGKSGSDVNHRLKQGCTLAKLSLVEEAFANGASVTARDAESCTPMHWLAKCDVMDPTVVRAIYDLLMAKGAPLTAIDTFGETPMNAAAKRGSMIMGKLFDDMLDRGLIQWVNTRSQDGETALDGAVSFGDDGLVLRMLEAGISPRLTPEERKKGVAATLSHTQSSNGNPRRLTRLLIAYGADSIDASERDQYLTPLLASVIVPKRLTELLNAFEAQGKGSIPYAVIEHEARKEGMDESVAICHSFRARKAIQAVAAIAKQAKP